LELRLSNADCAAGQIWLRDESGQSLASPSAVRSFSQGPDAIAIAFVIQGNEHWMGNDEIEKSPEAQYRGVLPSLSITLAELARTFAAPRGSVATVITYSEGAQVRASMRPINEIANALGTQRDYRGRIANDLRFGIEAGLAQLATTKAPLKLLIIIGDGMDADLDSAPRLARLGEVAKEHGVSVHAITYKSVVSSDGYMIRALAPESHQHVVSLDGMGKSLLAILARAADRCYLTFTSSRLPWDGDTHALRLDTGEFDVRFGVVLPRFETWRGWRILREGTFWLLALVGAITIVQWGMRRRGRWR
jgi:hypothetical protein